MDLPCDREELTMNAVWKSTGAALSAAAGLLLARCGGYMGQSGQRFSECHDKGGHSEADVNQPSVWSERMLALGLLRRT